MRKARIMADYVWSVVVRGPTGRKRLIVERDAAGVATVIGGTLAASTLTSSPVWTALAAGQLDAHVDIDGGDKPRDRAARRVRVEQILAALTAGQRGRALVAEIYHLRGGVEVYAVRTDSGWTTLTDRG